MDRTASDWSDSTPRIRSHRSGAANRRTTATDYEP
jgi:hypothetical protein